MSYRDHVVTSTIRTYEDLFSIIHGADKLKYKFLVFNIPIYYKVLEGDDHKFDITPRVYNCRFNEIECSINASLSILQNLLIQTTYLKHVFIFQFPSKLDVPKFFWKSF